MNSIVREATRDCKGQTKEEKISRSVQWFQAEIFDFDRSTLL